MQHTSRLVKHTTLKLLALVLKQAQDVTQNYSQQTPENNTADMSFIQLFREGVFKVLPDVKTVISLRQNLVAEKQIDSAKEGCSSVDRNEQDKFEDDKGNTHPDTLRKK